LGLDPVWLLDQEGRPMFNMELSVDSFRRSRRCRLVRRTDLADAPGLASHLITAVAACGPSIIVDLAGLELIDSCGLGVLVRVLKWTRESGGDMALAAERACRHPGRRPAPGSPARLIGQQSAMDPDTGVLPGPGFSSKRTEAPIPIAALSGEPGIASVPAPAGSSPTLLPCRQPARHRPVPGELP
jgi:anti-anti-sigma factor